MDVKLKDPTRVYYCKEQKLSFAGKEVIETKVTQHVRQLLNEGALQEVRTETVSDEVKAAIVAEAKEEERVEKLTPAEKAAETKAKKEAAKKAAELKEKA